MKNEFEVKDYLAILRKRLWILILITTIFLVTSGVVSFYFITPQYESFSTLMVGKPADYDKELEYSDVLLNQQLVPTYAEIAKSKLVANETINSLGLNLTYKKFQDKVNVELVNDSEIIKIKVMDTKPAVAAKIANKVSEIFMKHAARIMKIDNIQIIDVAEKAAEPIKPKPLLNITIAGILGIMIAIFLIFFLEYIDNSIKTVEDVEKYMGLPIIGTIPKLHKKVEESIVLTGNPNTINKDPKRPAAEAYRTIRTNIQFFNINRNIKSLVITSTEPGEGKSSVVINLAAALALNGKSVLLIDSDLRKPKIHSYLGLSNETGLTNLLIGETDYKGVIKTVDGIDKLEILTSGPIPPNPSEILSSERMKIFMDKVNQEYGLVIFDSSPVSLVTDAVVLSTNTDAVVLVCAVGQAEIEKAINAKVSLEKVKANILGVVMNKMPVKKSKNFKKENYYYYYY